MKFSKTLMSNIAQILICVLFAPFLCAFLKLVASDGAISIVTELVNSIPILELWFDLLLRFDGLEGLEKIILELESSATVYLYISVWQVYAIAIVFEILNTITDKIGWRGFKIIPAVASVFIAIVLQKLTGEDILILTFEIIFLFILYIVIVFLISKVNAIKTIVTVCIRLFIDAYIALFATMYLAALGLLSTGRINGIKESVVCIGMSFVGLLISVVLSYLVSPRKNK